ncbi:MAG TPA: TA system VapC family ribonuclease toxin [Vicinamibacterales bacterium]|nr:TA system VapC family ribonuclease toxin [Vicinamibacterales bacterium]
MILVDANLLVYAANTASPEHARARAWLDDRLNGTARVGLPWTSLLAFVRLVSNPLVVRRPVSPKEAWGQACEWLACVSAWIPGPGEEHQAILTRFVEQPWMTSRLVPDAHLAALAIEHGLTCCSSDSDFARFPGLKWENPLAVEA